MKTNSLTCNQREREKEIYQSAACIYKADNHEQQLANLHGMLAEAERVDLRLYLIHRLRLRLRLRRSFRVRSLNGQDNP